MTLDIKKDAGKLMEEYIEFGYYHQLKALEKENDRLNHNIHQHLFHAEAKRHEIGNHLVAKFITKNIYDYDLIGLNEFLYDRGLLQNLIRLSSSNFKKNQELLDLFETHSLKPSYFLKPSLNKVGKELLKMEEPPVRQFSLEEASRRKRETITNLRTARNEYEKLKKQMEQCQWLIAEGKVTHKYGSITMVQKPLIYNTHNMMDKNKILKLIEYGKPEITGVINYASRGFLSKSDIESFRKLIDIKLNFVILDINDEKNIMKRRQDW